VSGRPVIGAPRGVRATFATSAVRSVGLAAPRPSRGSRSDLAAGPRPQVADLRCDISRCPIGYRIGSRDPPRRGDPSRL